MAVGGHCWVAETGNENKYSWANSQSILEEKKKNYFYKNGPKIELSHHIQY